MASSHNYSLTTTPLHPSNYTLLRENYISCIQLLIETDGGPSGPIRPSWSLETSKIHLFQLFSLISPLRNILILASTFDPKTPINILYLHCCLFVLNIFIVPDCNRSWKLQPVLSQKTSMKNLILVIRFYSIVIFWFFFIVITSVLVCVGWKESSSTGVLGNIASFKPK